MGFKRMLPNMTKEVKKNRNSKWFGEKEITTREYTPTSAVKYGKANIDGITPKQAYKIAKRWDPNSATKSKARATARSVGYASAAVADTSFNDMQARKAEAKAATEIAKYNAEQAKNAANRTYKEDKTYTYNGPEQVNSVENKLVEGGEQPTSMTTVDEKGKMSDPSETSKTGNGEGWAISLD